MQPFLTKCPSCFQPLPQPVLNSCPSPKPPSHATFSHQLSKMFLTTAPTCSYQLSKACSHQLFSTRSHQLFKPVLTNCPNRFSPSVQPCSHQLSKSGSFSVMMTVKSSSLTEPQITVTPCKHLTYSTNQQSGKGGRGGGGEGEGVGTFHTWSNTWMVIKKSLQRHGSLFNSILSESF
jgi:hypothetical protein